MLVGISTGSLFPRCSTEDALKKIKELGADTAEVLFSTFYEYRPEFAKSIQPTVAGLKINSLHTVGTNFEPNLFSPSRRVRGDGFYWLDQIARSAQLLGAESYTFHGMHRLCAWGEEDLDALSGCVRSAAEFLGGYGVKLCLENVSWCLYNRPGIFTKIKERFPALCGVFDIKQARRSGYPYGMYIKEMGSSIAYAHISDIDKNGNMCLPGRGVTNFKEVVARLLDVGFCGNIIIENYSDDYSSFEELSDSVAFVKSLL